MLWGAWYVPGSAVWFEAPYVNLSYDTNAEFLLAAAVLTTFNAVAVLFFLFVWTGVLGKWGEYVRTIRQMRNISKWFFIGAIFGGPIAIFGSYLAIGYIGGAFAAISALMYPIIGATLANGGLNPVTGERALAQEHVRSVLSVMNTCGMYDYAGGWQFSIGLPARAG